MEHVVGLVAYREEVSRHLDQDAVHPFPFLDDSGVHLAETRDKDGFGFGKNGDHKADQCPTLRPLQDQSIARCPCRLERAILESKLRSELQRLGARDHRRGEERHADGQSAKEENESAANTRTRSGTHVWPPFAGDPIPGGECALLRQSGRQAPCLTRDDGAPSHDGCATYREGSSPLADGGLAGGVPGGIASSPAPQYPEIAGPRMAPRNRLGVSSRIGACHMVSPSTVTVRFRAAPVIVADPGQARDRCTERRWISKPCSSRSSMSLSVSTSRPISSRGPGCGRRSTRFASPMRRARVTMSSIGRRARRASRAPVSPIPARITSDIPRKSQRPNPNTAYASSSDIAT